MSLQRMVRDLNKSDDTKLNEAREYIEVAQNAFSESQKKEFDNLWSFFCSNFNEIKIIKSEIIDCDKEIVALKKGFDNFTLILTLAFIAACNVKYFSPQASFDYGFMIICVIVIFGFTRASIDIKLLAQIIQIKTLNREINVLRKKLYEKKIPTIDYENKFIEAESKYFYKDTDKHKIEHDRYNDLFYTHAYLELVKIVQKNSEVVNDN